MLMRSGLLPDAGGRVMSAIKPRMAVAFHTVLLPDIAQGMLEGIRKTYSGPLTIATDLMVWNVTKDNITMRQAVFADRVTPPPTTEGYRKAKRSGEAKMSRLHHGRRLERFYTAPIAKEVALHYAAPAAISLRMILRSSSIGSRPLPRSMCQ